MAFPELSSLYLTGGKSSRMGENKSQLIHHEGATFQQHVLSLLTEQSDQVCLSTNFPDENQDLRQIVDVTPDRGPLAGLESAFHYAPDHAWLIVACDLPNVCTNAITELKSVRSQDHDVVCFKNPYDGVPEPLMAIFEPSAHNKLLSYLDAGQRCARHFLDTLSVRSLDATSPSLLQNLNYPEDYQEWKLSREHEPKVKSITVEYFAKLKQDADRASEERTTEAITCAGLWEECRLDRQLSLTLPNVKPAINNAFTSWDAPLNDGDLVAFMPPFAGG